MRLFFILLVIPFSLQATYDASCEPFSDFSVLHDGKLGDGVEKKEEEVNVGVEGRSKVKRGFVRENDGPLVLKLGQEEQA